MNEIHELYQRVKENELDPDQAHAHTRVLTVAVKHLDQRIEMAKAGNRMGDGTLPDFKIE